MPGFATSDPYLVDHLDIRSSATDPSARLASLLREQVVTITGSRACTAYGAFIAADLGTELAEQGITLLTGAAFGIESHALRSFLAAGGKAIVVMPCGVDQILPGQDGPLLAGSSLLETVRAKGVVISQEQPGAVTSRTRFVARNTLIANLTGALVVVESAERTAAMAMAEAAAQVGAAVFAVPGPITSIASGGSHRLIQSGVAQLLTTVTDLPLGSMRGTQVQVRATA
jgi:DNA processing protein